jgi:hypothetical protein
MPCVGFEPTIPASERAKTVHALDRPAAVSFEYAQSEFKGGRTSFELRRSESNRVSRTLLGRRIL